MVSNISLEMLIGYALMKIAFELSGEHATLPRAEVIACLESLNIDFREVAFMDQLLIVDVQDVPPIAKHLAMTHHILEVIFICPANIKSILRLVSNADLSIEDRTFCIRAKHIRGADLSSTALEKETGAIVHKKGYRVDLDNPDVMFHLVLTEDQCVFGRLIESVDRGQYELRKPKQRPFFHPGVLLPRLAHALVNISSVSDGILLDPFCGTGGILIEAALTGAQCVGMDVQQKMVLGTSLNLKYYDIGGLLIIGDACATPLRSEKVDAVVTDLPYGRSALIQARSLEHLYRCSLSEIYRVLKKNKKAVIVSQMPLDKLAEEVGFIVKESYQERVHRSLTRQIIVLQKQK
ncbi:MAG: THUMP domain-containing protein [Methanocellales archaeon]|nr:THUMP domain-containing protein [Methanocellales archaeon]MDD5236008.1 THUMP domain-containing protein [Methanocellales archaeon]